MMKERYTYPHTIRNGGGEAITFLGISSETGRDVLKLTANAEPGCGPAMHVHFRQDESLTVVSGKMGVQIQGVGESFHGPGETVVFKAGQAHRFWNAGNETLECSGWISPAGNVEYFLTELYKTTLESGGKRPGTYEGAFLLKKYRSEFGLVGIPGFVRNILFPVALFFGNLTGKHKKYQDGPAPLL